MTSYPKGGDGPITGELLLLLLAKLVTYFNFCDPVLGDKPSEGGAVQFGPGFEACMPSWLGRHGSGAWGWGCLLSYVLAEGKADKGERHCSD